MRLAPFLVLVACGSPAPDIVGRWMDPGGIVHDIDAERWTASATGFEAIYLIEEVDNDAAFLLARNHEDNSSEAGRYSRFDWTEHRASTWYCHTVFDGETLEDARAGSADRSNPDDDGCGGFPWTELLPLEPDA